MTAADKIEEARKVRRFKLVSEDGWHGMTVRPDGGYVSHKDYAALADLADAQAQENARLLEALDPNHTKADYIGEFRERVCFGTDEEGNEIWQYVPISWDVIKQIMAAIRARAALGDAP